MPSRKILVQLVGDADKLVSAFKRGERAGKGFGSSMGGASSSLKGFAKAGAAGAALGGIALTARFLGSAAEAAKDAQVAQVNLQQALKQSGNSFARYGKEIDGAINRTSKLSAFDDEDLSQSLATLVRTTGSVTKATKGMGLAANIARARNVSLETATKAVERAFAGSETGLRRYGVVIPKVSENMDALKEKENKLRDALKGTKGARREEIEAQIDALRAMRDTAREQDKAITTTQLIDKALRQFSGSAEAYGKTATGAQERLGVAFENLQERVGKHLIPVLTKLAIKLTELIEWSEKNWPKFANAVADAWDKIRPIFEGFKSYFEAWVKLIAAVIEGDWRKAWGQIDDVIKSQLKIVAESLKLFAPRFLKAGIALGDALAKGIVEGMLGGLPGPLRRVLSEAIKLQYGVTQAKLISGILEGGFGGGQRPPPSEPRGRISGTQRRAHGGPVLAGRSYLVGEQGMEILTMGRTGGFVTPNTGGSIIIQNAHFHGVQNVREMAAELQRFAKHGTSQTRGRFGGQNLALT